MVGRTVNCTSRGINECWTSWSRSVKAKNRWSGRGDTAHWGSHSKEQAPKKYRKIAILVVFKITFMLPKSLLPVALL